MLYGGDPALPARAAPACKKVDASAAANDARRAGRDHRRPTKGADLRWYYSRTVFTKLFDPTCRFEGEAVAAVAAETPQQAWDAVRAIAVEYEVLPFVVDERKALEPGAPPFTSGGNRVGEPEKYQRGDVAKGLRRGRQGPRGDLPHRGRDPHPDGAARLRRELGRAAPH